MEATDLWHALYTGAHGLLELPVIPGRAHAERLFLPVGNQRAHADAPAVARWYDGRGIVTFGVQPRRRKGGEKRDVLAVVALTVDMDCPDEATRDSAREKLEAFRLPYSALVSSGHGLHAYWLLGAPLPVQGPAGPANAARYESVAQRLARRLGADHPWDLPRVLGCRAASMASLAGRRCAHSCWSWPRACGTTWPGSRRRCRRSHGRICPGSADSGSAGACRPGWKG